MGTTKRVLVIVNKWWECDPIMLPLLSNNARPWTPATGSPLGWPVPLQPARPRQHLSQPVQPDLSPQPRAIFHMSNIDVEVWCISDVLEHLPDTSPYQSSSEQKKANMGRIFAGGIPALVIAMGTAGYPLTENVAPGENGSVVVGTSVFMHNGNLGGANPDSNWQGGPFDDLLPSSLDPALFARFVAMDTPTSQTVLNRFIIPPLKPAQEAHLFIGYNNVALGDINITDPNQYAAKDPEVIAAYCQQYDPVVALSLETTHGLIRTQSNAPFLFISGITNRVGHAPDELLLRAYAQQTSTAQNAGIVLAWMLPLIDAAYN